MSDSPDLELRARIEAGSPAEISTSLDALSHADRVTAIRGLGRRDQSRLYALVEGYRPLTLADLVPPDTPSVTAVRHHGKNTLPAFTHFEKRFCRPADGDPEKPAELYGFNFQAMQPLTGPGYFVAIPNPERADTEVWVDYRRVPSGSPLPSGWPGVRINERGVSRLVYGHMIDTLRRVSEHVTIGSAAKKGKDMGSWFVLCRQDSQGGE